MLNIRANNDIGCLLSWTVIHCPSDHLQKSLLPQNVRMLKILLVLMWKKSFPPTSASLKTLWSAAFICCLTPVSSSGSRYCLQCDVAWRGGLVLIVHHFTGTLFKWMMALCWCDKLHSHTRYRHEDPLENWLLCCLKYSYRNVCKVWYLQRTH